MSRHGLGGLWWDAVDRADWPDDAESRALIASRWQEPWGDRQQELVLIGIDMDAAALTAAFDACLLTDAELAAGADSWADLADPFPSWAEADDGVDAVGN